MNLDIILGNLPTLIPAHENLTRSVESKQPIYYVRKQLGLTTPVAC